MKLVQDVCLRGTQSPKRGKPCYINYSPTRQVNSMGITALISRSYNYHKTSKCHKTTEKGRQIIHAIQRPLGALLAD